MLGRFLLFFYLILPFNNAVANNVQSAIRRPGVSYKEYVQKALANKSHFETPLSAARYYSASQESNLPDAQVWKTNTQLRKRFYLLRDTRFLIWRRRPEFNRRISWLYPNDGCYARAAMVVKLAASKSIPVPYKVFAFGDLMVRTGNDPDGSVSWWYHVAAVVEVKNVKYVIDPSIDPAKPLRLRDWLSRMGNPEQIEVAICRSGAYNPSGDCGSDSDGTQSTGSEAQDRYLDHEWNRISVLGRNPERELGPRPPWKRIKH